MGLAFGYDLALYKYNKVATYKSSTMYLGYFGIYRI